MTRAGSSEADALVLRRQVRSRLLPLLVLLVFVVSLSAPLAVYFLGLRKLRHHAQTIAKRVAVSIQREARFHPELWKYNTAKLVAHVGAFQTQRGVQGIVVADAAGRSVNVRDSNKLHDLRRSALLWSSVSITVDGKRVGTVWVASSIHPIRRRFFGVLALFGLLGLLLGGLLYWIPLRTVGRAEARITSLVGQLEASQQELEQLNRTLEERIKERSAQLAEAYRDLQDKERNLREISTRAMAFQEADRRAIGRELHDGAGQALTAIRINLQLIRDQAGDRGELKDQAAKTLSLADETLEEIRRAVHSLGPAIVDEVGLPTAVERHCDDVAERTGLEILREVASDLPPLPTAIENACYRILQEGLHNAARHARAETVRVSLEATRNELTLTIQDDGQGFVPDEPSPGSGRGLPGIRERAALLGGSLSLDTAPQRGTRLQITFPLDGESPE